MSRIGKLPITIPDKVKVEINGQNVKVEGPKGQLAFDVPGRITPKLEDNVLSVARDANDSQAKALHGLSRALLNNLVEGVSKGFEKKLEIHGVGFKAEIKGKDLVLNLGYSHQCVYPIPDQLDVTLQDPTKITIAGPDKQLVGKMASEVRNFYPPEPYKGKGVRYAGETVVRKEGKTVQ